MSSHKRIYVTPSHTKKIFGNMKRVGTWVFQEGKHLCFQQWWCKIKLKWVKVQQYQLIPITHPLLFNHQHLNPKRNKDQEGQRERTLRYLSLVVLQPMLQIRLSMRRGMTVWKGCHYCYWLRCRPGQGSENVSKFSNDPLLERVIDLEKTKSAQAQEITSLKLRVKKLEKKGESRTHKLKRLYKVGRSARIVSSDEASLGRYGDYMFDVSDLAGEEVFVAEQGVSDKDVNLSVDEVTLAQALAALKSAKVQEKANVVEEPSESITTTPTLYNNKLLLQHLLLISTRPVGKGLVIHDEEQAIHHSFSQQSAHAKIQDKVEFDEQERIEREKAEANIALKETWDDIQAKIKADCLLAERLQAREQEELTIEERAILFQQLLEKRRKHFVAKRAKEKRNRPPTKAQQRSIMCTYLKNMEGWKHKDLKRKSFENIQELFDKAMKRVNTFVDYRTELVERSLENGKAEIAQESSSKRAGDELEEESIKKQKVDEDKETAELKSLMEVIPDEEEVAVDAIPLATKPPSIVDWKIHKEGKKSYYQIIRLMRKKLVKAKYGSTRPVEDLDLVLYGDLKTMFDPHVEDQVWKNQSDYRVLEWKLYDSCRVHSLRKQNVHNHMLVEKRYPLTPATITDMLNKKLKADHWNEMCYQLLKLITK
ncbi:hypothetical protein Tco_0157176 [Tanacetum coccineum]